MSSIKDFENDLGPEVVLQEEGGIPFVWGRHILRHLGDERFAELRAIVGYNKVIHMGDYFSHDWAVVTRGSEKGKLILQTIKKYGPITRVKVGPRGGFQWVEYGDGEGEYYGHNGTRFYTEEFNPLRYHEDQTEEWRVDKRDPVVKWDEPTEAMKRRSTISKRKKAAKEKRKEKKLAEKDSSVYNKLQFEKLSIGDDYKLQIVDAEGHKTNWININRSEFRILTGMLEG